MNNRDDLLRVPKFSTSGANRSATAVFKCAEEIETKITLGQPLSESFETLTTNLNELYRQKKSLEDEIIYSLGRAYQYQLQAKAKLQQCKKTSADRVFVLIHKNLLQAEKYLQPLILDQNSKLDGILGQLTAHAKDYQTRVNDDRRQLNGFIIAKPKLLNDFRLKCNAARKEMPRFYVELLDLLEPADRKGPQNIVTKLQCIALYFVGKKPESTGARLPDWRLESRGKRKKMRSKNIYAGL